MTESLAYALLAVAALAYAASVGVAYALYYIDKPPEYDPRWKRFVVLCGAMIWPVVLLAFVFSSIFIGAVRSAPPRARKSCHD